jgi:hypothetical protein
MALKFLKKRWQKVWFTAAVSFFAIIAILSFLINIYWSPILADKLRSTILTSTDSLYSVSFSSASLHILKGKIVIDKIELKPNIEVYNRRKKQHLAPNSLYDLQIKRLVINHVHPLKLYFDQKLDIAQIVISAPNLHVDYEQNRDQDTVIKDKKTPYQLISKVLKSIHIQSILLNDVKIKYTDHSGSKPDVSEFQDLNFVATDFLLDSVSQKDKSRFLFCSDLSAELNNYNGTSDDERYTYQIQTLRFSTRSSQLNIIGMSFLPTKGADDFFKGTKSDCFAIKLDSLRLDNFDFKIYSKYHTLYGSNLILTNGSVQIFDNPAPGDSTKDNSGSFPPAMLKKLKTDLRIDTIQVNKIGVTYTEYNKKSGQPGSVSFNNISGKFFNITNNKAALQKNNIATAQLQTYFMNYGKLDVQFAFNLTDERTPFTYKGQMTGMDLHKINPVTGPLAMVNIASGSLNKLDFNMRADNTVCRGNVTILYSDLKIALLKKGDDDKLKKMGIASLLANALVIKRNNPTGNEAPRTFNVVYKRPKSASFFSFMWKSLFVGLKSSVGYDASTEATVKQKIGEFQKSKLNHVAKKAMRLQRRAERRQRRALRKQAKESKNQAQDQQTENTNF